MNKKRWTYFFKKYHKWPSLFLSVFIILFSLSGIVLNHREAFSSYDISRSWLPNQYQYNNWNKAAVKSGLRLSGDSILIYGNIGVWLTTDNYNSFSDFNQGFSKGVDKRKVECMYRTSTNRLYAGTLFGLFKRDEKHRQWKKITLPVDKQRVVDIVEVRDSIYVLTRSHIIRGDCEATTFEIIDIPAPVNYSGKVSLFATLWHIHSGKMFGAAGSLFVDFLGIIFIFLCFSGWVYFLFPRWIRGLKKRRLPVAGKLRFLKLNLKWHKRLGYWLLLFFAVLTISGMFLRPPLLIAIGNHKVTPIPFTYLDKPNPWFDSFRRVLYNDTLDRFIIATNEQIFFSDDYFSSPIKKYNVVAPISVMGVTVFEQIGQMEYLVGSFQGLYRWNPSHKIVVDYISNKPVTDQKTIRSPFSSTPIAGYFNDLKNGEILFDYNVGAIDVNGKIPSMPDRIANTPISLWNLALEIHTGRFYRSFLGNYYILFIPLAGLAILMILITGYLLRKAGLGR